MLVLGGRAVGIWAIATEQSISAQALIPTSFRKTLLHPLNCIFPLFLYGSVHFPLDKS